MQALVGLDPGRFFAPAYLAGRGWIGARVDGREVDWEEIAHFVLVSYRLTAPKRLASLL
jgi:predicted DNA-binding protein (MmcQ/YjbR family)